MDYQSCTRMKDALGKILQKMESLLRFHEEGDGWIKQELRDLVDEAKGVLNTQMPVIPIPIMPESVPPFLDLPGQPRSEPVMLLGVF